MHLRHDIILLATLMVCISVACSGVNSNAGNPLIEKQGILIPPIKYVGPDEKIQWEGAIDGRKTSYYRPAYEGGMIDVVVVIKDTLPDYFKRIEYVDMDRDGQVDSVRMMIFEKDRGWREVGITKENKYGLRYADTQYKELVKKISMAAGSK